MGARVGIGGRVGFVEVGVVVALGVAVVKLAVGIMVCVG